MPRRPGCAHARLVALLLLFLAVALGVIAGKLVRGHDRRPPGTRSTPQLHK